MPVMSRTAQWLTLSFACVGGVGALPERSPAQEARQETGGDCLISHRSGDNGTAFVDVTVIPMDRERLLTKRTVLVRGCRIQAIGHRDSLGVPAGYRRIPGGDDIFLLPGLVDAHTHLRYDGDLTLYLAGGVTTVRNMDGSPRHLAWKEQIRRGLFGPRVFTAGPTGAYHGVKTRAEVERAIDSLANAGYDFVKVFDPLPADNYRWVLDAAKRANLPVAGHIPRALGAQSVLQLGRQATIEHAEQFVYHWFNDDPDRTRLDELVKQVKAAGTAVTPTLEVIHSWVAVSDSPASLLARPETRWLHPETFAYWHTFARGSSFENRIIADFQQQIVQEFARAAVPLMTGTDAYMAGLIGPWALRREMYRMYAAGLTRFQVLRAATATPAAVLGHDTGIVAQGRWADLLLVRGNPLWDLDALSRIQGVMLDGVWHDGEALAARLDSLASEYRAGNAFVAAALARRVGPAITEHRVRRAKGDSSRTDAGVIAYVGSILRQWGRLDDAISVYDLAVEEDPRSASAHEGMARAFLAQGNVRDAIARLQRALEIDPSRQMARSLLAELAK